MATMIYFNNVLFIIFVFVSVSQIDFEQILFFVFETKKFQFLTNELLFIISR